MNTATYHTTSKNIPMKRAYPNAATRQEIRHKILDTLLVGAMGAGAAASLLFMLVVF